jgi:hypothetical protein
VLVYSKEIDYYQTLISKNQINFALRVLNVAKQSQANKVFSITSQEPFVLLRISWQACSQIKSDAPNSQN